MLVIVVVMFGICWLPLHAFSLVMDAHPEILANANGDQNQLRLLTGLYLSAHWLAMSNSFANPIIYGFTNESFRVRFSSDNFDRITSEFLSAVL